MGLARHESDFEAAGEARLALHFRDGELAVVPEGTRAAPRPAPKPVQPPPEQGKLL